MLEFPTGRLPNADLQGAISDLRSPAGSALDRAGYFDIVGNDYVLESAARHFNWVKNREKGESEGTGRAKQREQDGRWVHASTTAISRAELAELRVRGKRLTMLNA